MDRNLTAEEQEFLQKVTKKNPAKTKKSSTSAKKRWLHILGKVHIGLFSVASLIPIITVVFAMVIASRFQSLLESDFVRTLLADEDAVALVEELSENGSTEWIHGLLWWETNSWWILLSSLGIFILLALGILLLEYRRRVLLGKLDEQEK